MDRAEVCEESFPTTRPDTLAGLQEKPGQVIPFQGTYEEKADDPATMNEDTPSAKLTHIVEEFVKVRLARGGVEFGDEAIVTRFLAHLKVRSNIIRLSLMLIKLGIRPHRAPSDFLTTRGYGSGVS